MVNRSRWTASRYPTGSRMPVCVDIQSLSVVKARSQQVPPSCNWLPSGRIFHSGNGSGHSNLSRGSNCPTHSVSTADTLQSPVNA